MSEVALRLYHRDGKEMRIGLDTFKVCYWWDVETQGWWIYLPGCGAGRLTHHTVTENDDRTITVAPSIRLTGHRGGTPTQRHGFLERGVWREC